MPFHVKIRKKNPAGKPGKCFGTFGPFTTQKLAKKQAQVFADDAAPGMVVTVEPVRAANPRKRKKARKKRRRNPDLPNLTVAAFNRVVQGDPDYRKHSTKFHAHSDPTGLRPSKRWVENNWFPTRGYVVVSRPGNTHYDLIYPGMKMEGGKFVYAPRKKWNQIGPFANLAAAKAAMAGERGYANERTARIHAIETFLGRRSNPRGGGYPSRSPQPPVITASVMSNPRRRNGRVTTRTHKGHAIKGKTGNYVVIAYDKAFTTLKAAKGWIDRHVAAELRKLNPRRR